MEQENGWQKFCYHMWWYRDTLRIQAPCSFREAGILRLYFKRSFYRIFETHPFLHRQIKETLTKYSPHEHKQRVQWGYLVYFITHKMNIKHFIVWKYALHWNPGILLIYFLGCQFPTKFVMIGRNTAGGTEMEHWIELATDRLKASQSLYQLRWASRKLNTVEIYLSCFYVMHQVLRRVVHCMHSYR